MYSKKEDFLNQLQFELGHRWPDIELDSVKTIENLADFVLIKHKASKWPFLRFIPFYFTIKTWTENKLGNKISADYDLNKLPKTDKSELIAFIESEFEKPIAFRRPPVLQTIVFIAPLFFILIPLLISTYLITAKDYPGWLYVSGLIGILLTLGLFKLTEQTKKQFQPATLLEYSKAFFVIHNQRMSDEARKEDVVTYLCSSAEKFYKHPFTSNSPIPEG